MRSIKSNLELYLNKTISNSHHNQKYFSLLSGNSIKSIKNLSITKNARKPSLVTFHNLSIVKTESKNFSNWEDRHRSKFLTRNSKPFLSIRPISKRFASKESKLNKSDKIENKKSNKDTKTETNNSIKVKSKKENKAPSSSKSIERDNRTAKTKSFVLTSQKNYNPEAIDKQSNLFNLTDKLPEKIQHFIKLGRYDRPIGYMLLFYPCTWGLTLGTPILDYNYLYHIFLFFSGSVLMRSAGCIINDMWDRDIDKKVERSKTRPLAAGHLTIKEACGFLALHLALSLVILLKLPFNCILAGLGVMPFVIIYPLMKRVINMPQLILGIAFNSGFIVGYPAFTGLIHQDITIPFFAGGILWTLVYDTLYAHMDKIDDAKINVKSSALYFGNKTKQALYIITIIMSLLFFFGMKSYERRFIDNYDETTQMENEIEEDPDNDKNIKVNNSVYKSSNASEFDIKEFRFWNYHLSDFIITIAQFYQLYVIKNTNLNDPLSCLKAFKKSSIYGILILIYCLSKVKKRDDLIQIKKQDEISDV